MLPIVSTVLSPLIPFSKLSFKLSNGKPDILFTFLAWITIPISSFKLDKFVTFFASRTFAIIPSFPNSTLMLTPAKIKSTTIVTTRAISVIPFGFK